MHRETMNVSLGRTLLVVAASDGPPWIATTLTRLTELLAPDPFDQLAAPPRAAETS